ncbi:hypothetical protein MnTg02_02811 [bacterium MnTg02]|nr:hypothetical protein MnTg02_02811 [bacterium MnTg02]
MYGGYRSVTRLFQHSNLALSSAIRFAVAPYRTSQQSRGKLSERSSFTPGLTSKKLTRSIETGAVCPLN